MVLVQRIFSTGHSSIFINGELIICKKVSAISLRSFNSMAEISINAFDVRCENIASMLNMNTAFSVELKDSKYWHR